MQSSSRYDYDVVVVGAGHAGAEAALAAARLGARTALLSISLDTVGAMSCNPAIGGVGKGQIVREIDALGGAMGRAIDATGLQFRLLNRRKGPAMHGPRAQADKKRYQLEIKRVVEQQPGLHLKQEVVEDLLTEEGQGGTRMVGVRVRGHAEYRARCVILTTGTFLQALMHTGESQTPGGRAGEGTTQGISGALRRLGFRVARFKTGTPPRIHGRTIDFGQCELQPGDDSPQPFSFLTERLAVEQLPCWICYTNEQVHALIRANLHRAPMYTGQIASSGPRYCPSIEDKIVRFADKTQHQLFLEPEGYATDEYYVNGISTSLPRDVQDAILREIPALREAQVMRYGYAVEYDFCPPDQLQASLETKQVRGLYFAGQINGTTGYEEAAAQGLLAGANAGLALQGKDPLVLARDQAYMGVLVDDLVTRGVDEPYRMFTSRAEYRLRLRHDNADRRLTPLAAAAGLCSDRRWQQWQRKEAAMQAIREELATRRAEEVPLLRFLRRPEIDWTYVLDRWPELRTLDAELAEQVVWDIKYEGYVALQDQQVDRQKRLAEKQIPASLDYGAIRHLRAEAREKLQRIRPENLAQAGRISGITPADLALLTTHITAPRSPQNAADPTPGQSTQPQASQSDTLEADDAGRM
jgi:tRNA uridine 5-carboxymethylaminomethyl modification enzyme